MPTNPAKARILLKANKARVVHTTPFAIQLLYSTATEVQPLTHGVDTGSAVIGSAVTDSRGNVFYASEVDVRNDISARMKRRAEYRRNRRQRKTRYRASRFLNRRNSIRKDRFSPTMVSKIAAHLREVRFVNSILPITSTILETASFDPHALKNPEVLTNKILYQQGVNDGFASTKAYVLDRDGHRCQHRKGNSKDRRLHVHHIIFRRDGGSDDESNLLTLCETCHTGLHKGAIILKLTGKRKSALRHATQMNSIRVQLLRLLPHAQETFGFITKEHRQLHTGRKEHFLDAVFIATQGTAPILKTDKVLLKRCIPDGDSQRSKGVRSETAIPAGKIMGFRKFDKVRYQGDVYFIKGRFRTGYAILMRFDGRKVDLKPIPKFTRMKRLAARKSWIRAIYLTPPDTTGCGLSKVANGTGPTCTAC
jgi:hypothetical protein